MGVFGFGSLCITAAHGWMHCIGWWHGVEYLASTMVCMVMWIYLLRVLTLSSWYSYCPTETQILFWSCCWHDSPMSDRLICAQLRLESHRTHYLILQTVVLPPRDHVWNNLTKLKRCDPSTTSNKAISSPSWPKQISKKKSLSQKVHLRPLS